MLGKLIKYDLKALNPILIFVHAFLLLAALCIRIFISGRLFNEDSDFSGPYTAMAVGLLVVLFSLAVVLVLFSTELLIAMRFYKNLFSGEGYLTLTLPVTTGQHLLSRTISGTLWGTLDMFLCFFSVYLAFATPYVRETVGHELLQAWEELLLMSDSGLPSPAAAVCFCILFCITGVAASVLTIYASVTVGQVLFGHRIIGAVAIYFVINTAFSILSFIALALTGGLNMFFNPATFNPAMHVVNSLVLTEWLSAASILALYLLTYYMMKKKINLD